ncbi:Protocatechuate 4,5-dioxygenase beta chain [Roseivivax jejudonensis]|uniref:Protocatechuate 4,5-dioxygenase beta chain n=1 Tax=Roseivivax jejudonensis TaxID=1529041 RepID=A0A1X7A5W3_9RHOB|nr:class III extradiol dioxygenase family protein [Roseivivax jejudonensis]SLN71022.1 Protocatechuate 4,5-dioxygenase beta chain [Roseivivax jejudonensis]
MAKLVGAVTTSHVPSIGIAMDKGITQDDYWKPLFDGYLPAKEFVKELAPDVTIVVYNDHGLEVFLDRVPTFGIGAAAGYESGDEGWGPRPIPPFLGHPDLSWHLIEQLVAREFDMTMFQEMKVDHGFTVPMSVAFGGPAGEVDEWPTKVVPLTVNTIQFPLPQPARCLKLGQAIRKAVEAYPEDLRIMVLGTGGMSHQLQGERAGFMQPPFDRMFLDKFAPEPEELAKIPLGDYMKSAGHEGAELIMWLVARGALNDAREVYRHYHVSASLTAAGLGCYVDAESPHAAFAA